MDSTLSSMTRLYPELQGLISTIPQMTVAQRKAVLTCARIQQTPPSYPPPKGEQRSLLWEQFPTELSTMIPIKDKKTIVANMSIADFLRSYDNYISSPVRSGFISMLVRNLPFDNHQDVSDMLWDTYTKELESAINIYHPTTFSWDYLFQYDKRPSASKFHPDYSIDDPLRRRIAALFLHAKERLNGSRLYPDYSTKTMGREASNIYRMSSEEYEGVRENSTRGLER